jgi:CheY-like chemotaxis protein
MSAERARSADLNDFEEFALVASGSGRGASPDRGRPASILVVDDVEANRAVFTAMLGFAGHDVESVASAEDAFAALKLRDFDLILMDLTMPGCGGLDATRHIRASGICSPSTPIIGLTAAIGVGHEGACLAAGMQGFLSKPIPLERLTGAVAAWLE